MSHYDYRRYRSRIDGRITLKGIKHFSQVIKRCMIRAFNSGKLLITSKQFSKLLQVVKAPEGYSSSATPALAFTAPCSLFIYERFGVGEYIIIDPFGDAAERYT